MYATLKMLHIGCAVLTISGFALRGSWMLTKSPLLSHRMTRILPHVVDTVFLLSGVAMLFLLSLNPFTQVWLNAKFAGLLAYIVLGTIALRRGPTRTIRGVAFVAAVLVFAWVAGVARTHSAWSWLAG